MKHSNDYQLLKEEYNLLKHEYYNLKNREDEYINMIKSHIPFKLDISSKNDKHKGAIVNFQEAFIKIIEFSDLAEVPITKEFLEIGDKLTSFSSLSLLDAYFETSKIFKAISLFLIDNIPKGIMTIKQSTRTTAFTIINQGKSLEVIDVLQNIAKNIENEEDLAKYVENPKQTIEKSNNVKFNDVLRWQRKLRHENLSLNKKKRLYLFSKTINKEKYSLNIKFESTPNFACYKLLCQKWDSFLKMKGLNVKTCWENHNILKSKNEKFMMNLK